MRSLCGIVLLAGLSAAQDPLSAELAGIRSGASGVRIRLEADR